MAKSAGVEDVASLTGSLAASGYSEAFTPNPGNAINLTLTGTWVGSVALFRSFDGGATKVACTLGGVPVAWTGNISEVVWAEPQGSVLLYAYFSRTSGTVDYRFGEQG